MKIPKRMDTKENRDFWASFPIGIDSSVPSIGEDWWEAETELSFSLWRGEDEN